MDFKYSLHYNRPLRFEWDVYRGRWHQRSTEITFAVYSGRLLLDERTVTVRLDEATGKLGLDDSAVPFLPNWNFEARAKETILLDEAGQELALSPVYWNVEKPDQNTVQVQNFTRSKTSPVGDGAKTQDR